MITEQAIPKFAAIAETLRRRIQEGVYAPGTRMPSSNELPSEFGVGKQTIVRVLADLAREGLIVSRQGLGTFVASALPATGTHAGQTKVLTLALVFRRTLNPDAYALRGWFGGVVAGVLNHLGMDAQKVVVTPLPSSDQEPGRVRLEQAGVPYRVELLGEPPAVDSGVPIPEIFALRPDAILPVSICDDAYLQRLLDAADIHGVPAVLIDYWTRALSLRADSVVVDSHPGYHAASEWLLERGLRRIHFVGAYNVSHTPGHFRAGQERRGRVDPDSYLRMAAWRQALDESGMDAPSTWTHFTAEMPADLERLAEALWTLPSEERPEALVCHNATIAGYLQTCIERRGGALPAIGVGAPGENAILSVRAEDVGRMASDLALARLREHRIPRERRPFVKAAVPTQFVQPFGGRLP